ncbi:hypothetical protein SUBVAR_07258 [Subdoligranulum variabile DSM 15176]|uniref:Uncharacterized protein n=1 Tax=Subdoligranulum variabile DSM 15176 TaxID=411471 RepID=D1PS74_9FIRM|nr:hypothetical protein SUBVAR_07258 [Subdoligranulum variabile DSM 15176]
MLARVESKVSITFLLIAKFLRLVLSRPRHSLFGSIIVAFWKPTYTFFAQIAVFPANSAFLRIFTGFSLVETHKINRFYIVHNP